MGINRTRHILYGLPGTPGSMNAVKGGGAGWRSERRATSREAGRAAGRALRRSPGR